MQVMIRQEQGMQKIKHKRLVFYIAIIAFPIVQFCIFYIYVNLNSILLAFKKFDFETGGYVMHGFDNFKTVIDELFVSRTLWRSLCNSLLISALSLSLGTVMPVFISYYIYKKRFMHKLFNVLLMLPSILSAFALVLAYRYFLEVAIPEIIFKLTEKKVTGLLTNVNSMLSMVLLYTYWFGMGTTFLLYVSTMTSIPDSVIEAAKIDGASPFIEFTRIIVPMIYPTYITFVVMMTATIFANQANIYHFFGNEAYPTVRNIAYYLYRRAAVSDFTDYPYLSAFGVLCSLSVMPLCYGVKRLLEKIGPSTE